MIRTNGERRLTEEGGLIDRNAEFTEQAVKVVVAVVVDRDMTLFLAMVEGDAGVEALAELVLEVLDVGGRFLGGLALATAFAGLAIACEVSGDKLLGIAHGGRGADQFFREQDLLVVPLEREQDLGVSGAQASLRQVVLHFGCEFQQAHGIGHGGTALADASADLLLGEPEFLGKPCVGGGLLDRVESFTLEILNEGQLEDLLITGLADDDGCLGQAHLQRGAQAAFARDELILPGDEPDDQRLDDAALADRVDEFPELLFPELGSGLKGAGDDPVEGDLLDAFAVLHDGCGCCNTGIDERTEPLAKPFAESFGRLIPSCFSDL